MTTESDPNRSDFEDDVTLAAADQSIEQIKAETPRADDEVSVWTSEGEPADGESFTDEPTVIRGFGDESTTPLDDQVRAQVAELRAEPEPAPVASPPVASPPRISGASLIDGVEPPRSSTSFFEAADLAATPTGERQSVSGHETRFPIGLVALGVLLVAIVITIVLAVLFGTSGL